MAQTVRKLYEEDVDLRSFEAEVVSCEPYRGAWRIALDQTAFYPEGGGQPADHGTLGDAQVLDVHEVSGQILHTADRPLAVGSRVQGEVDPIRRLDMMQQHTGEHILSGTICRIKGCSNVGFHLGEEAVTVDFNTLLTPEELCRIERIANEAVWQDVPVRIWYPDAEELKTLPYRSKKEIEGAIRIVSIPGYDLCACCGTHVHSAGQVGQIKIVDAIHYKGGMRLTILCGMRALRHAQATLEEAQKVSHLLSARMQELAEAAAQLQAERDQWKAKAGLLAARLFEASAAAETGKPVRVVSSETLGSDQMAKAASSLSAGAHYALVLIPADSGWRYALASGDADVRTASAELQRVFGGRGGGRPDLVQGLLAGGSPEEFRALLSKL